MIAARRAAIAAGLSLTVAATAAAHDLRYHVFEVERSRTMLGNLCSAVAQEVDSATTAIALDRALDAAAQLERILSSWRKDTELARFNSAGPAGHDCSPELYNALDSSRVMAEATDGAFDPTIEPLNQAWDTRGQGRVPDPAARSAAKTLVGWQDLALEPARRRASLRRLGMAVDLGGVARGLALDCAADTLRARRLHKVLLNFGGEVLGLGDWTVTVAHPADRTPVFRVNVSDAAVSTSDPSDRGYDPARKTGRMLDPRSGEPVPFAGSVTVVAGSATRANALAAGLVVMGRDAARRWAKKHPEVGVLWIEPNGRGLKAWKWNLTQVESRPDVEVAWMR
jgi:FAD:protein FMN transferase